MVFAGFILITFAPLLKLADGSDPSLYHGKIIECSWDIGAQEWIFMKVRVDKATPNEFGTYLKVQFIAIVYILICFLESFKPFGLNDVAC